MIHELDYGLNEKELADLEESSRAAQISCEGGSEGVLG